MSILFIGHNIKQMIFFYVFSLIKAFACYSEIFVALS